MERASVGCVGKGISRRENDRRSKGPGTGKQGGMNGKQ